MNCRVKLDLKKQSPWATDHAATRLHTSTWYRHYRTVTDGRRCIRYDLRCSIKLTDSQLSLPHETNKKCQRKTKNKLTTMISPVQSHYHESSAMSKEEKLSWEGFVEKVGFEPRVKEWRSDWWMLRVTMIRIVDKWMRRWIACKEDALSIDGAVLSPVMNTIRWQHVTQEHPSATNHSHLRLLLSTGLPSWQWDWTGPIMLIVLFLVSHFNFVVCSVWWTKLATRHGVSSLLHVKYTVSYRIVSYFSWILSTLPNQYDADGWSKHSFAIYCPCAILTNNCTYVCSSLIHSNV